MMQKHNFSAGPSILPKVVFEEAAQAVVDYQGTGLSLMEVSHRGPEFDGVLAEAKSLVSELLGLDDRYKVLFLSGGASSQFFMTAMNLLDTEDTAYYVDTGIWSVKAIKEARRFGNIVSLASSKDTNYDRIPTGFSVPADGKYLHLTSNNTIYGTQYHWWPDAEIPVVVDMSSDIFSRHIDANQFALIYAGAQKNMGPAGTTLVVVRENILGKIQRDIPSMLDYRIHIKEDSCFNTPPVFPIYVSMLNMRWLKAQGGIGALEERNSSKAAHLYAEIDSNPLFKGNVQTVDRSHMNATFVTHNPELEKPFIQACEAAGIVGIKGHRSAGGFRASMYNALPYESVDVLVQVMKEFGKTHG
jgi:phosphoserine aminotransferase